MTDNQSGEVSITILDDTLDDTAFTEYRNITRAVRDLSPMLSSFWTFQNNHQELVETAHDVLQLFTESGGDFYRRESIAQEAKSRMSQRTSNLLASASALLKHSERHLADKFGRESSRYVAWNDFRKDLHAESFAYRFLYELRNFNQHASIPITAVTAKGENLDDSERATVSMKVLVSWRDLLNQNYEWKPSVRSELENVPWDIDLLSEISQYAACMRDLFGKFLDQWIEELIDGSRYMDEFRLRLGAPEGSSVLYFDREPAKDVNEHGGVQLRLEGMKFFPIEMTKSIMDLHQRLTRQTTKSVSD